MASAHTQRTKIMIKFTPFEAEADLSPFKSSWCQIEDTPLQAKPNGGVSKFGEWNIYFQDHMESNSGVTWVLVEMGWDLVVLFGPPKISKHDHRTIWLVL